MKNLDYLTNYKTYIGKPIEIFPKIRSDGRKILSFAGFGYIVNSSLSAYSLIGNSKISLSSIINHT